MYFFLIVGLPSAFLFLILRAYPRSEYRDSRKAFLRGLAAFIPLWLVSRLLGIIVPAVYGSFFLSFHEWADRLLPYAVLPALAYMIFYRPHERLPLGASQRRLTSFYAGALAPVGLCEAMRIWGRPSPYVLFFLPFLLAAICLLMPKAAAALYEGYGFGLAKAIAGIAAATFAASLCPFFFLASLWPLALALLVAAGAAAWYFGYPDILRHPPVVFEE
jgi:hypothetical protein